MLPLQRKSTVSVSEQLFILHVTERKKKFTNILCIDEGGDREAEGIELMSGSH